MVLTLLILENKIQLHKIKSKLSDFCVVIKKRVLGLETPSYVAMYKDRPRDIREAYENTAKLLTWYEAQGSVRGYKNSYYNIF